MSNNELTGFILVNKPKGLTSFQCVKHLKRLLPKGTKIGHAGTLDPFATGLLVVAITRAATREIDKLLNLDKEYLVTAKLGELTDTLDYTGTILETADANQVTKQNIILAIKALGSSYIQIPPAYSALKHKGQPLYKLARTKQINEKEMEDVLKAKQRMVTIHNIELITFDSPYFTFKAHVSKGTYIRSLANDIAKQCNNIATTYKLQRTKIGSFSLEKAVNLDKIQSIDDIKEYLAPGFS